MGAIASQITSLTIVYSTVYLDADQRNIEAPRHWPLCGDFPDSPHKWPVTRNIFLFDDVIMFVCVHRANPTHTYTGKSVYFINIDIYKYPYG